ncbi:UNVERIFIED_CONTAM: hypothetical protein Scaly_1938800 [Sesamum calycinum]|uniref:DDE Tnp4 domain-containing protein n=1 Tax=Sesamum calycinum TaxID=2727403 RepID=A0AAW2NIF0_9LAMI
MNIGKGCLGALDGTYIGVRVLEADKGRYRTRTGHIAVNVLGKYYLYDDGYTNGDGFLIPYRDVRYHLREWDRGAMGPQTKEELFNLKHSSTRNIIECTFRLLKVRWGILKSQSFYPIEIQNRIIMACCLLHNFVRTEMPGDPLELEIPETAEPGFDSTTKFISTFEPNPTCSNWRDVLAMSMYNEWLNRNV